MPPLSRQNKCTDVRKQDVYAVIVSPTRELASQICEVLEVLLERLPQFSRQLLVGGGSAALDVQRLVERGANIIVATPGRLHDLLQRKETAARLQAALRCLVSQLARRCGVDRCWHHSCVQQHTESSTSTSWCCVL